MKTFFGFKANQLHAYDTNGKRLFVTTVKVDPLVVTQVKDQAKHGYHAVQIALGKKKNMNKPLSGHLKQIKDQSPRYLREIQLEAEHGKQINDSIQVQEVFELGDKVSVHAVSRGRGFAGVMKRWNFKGGPRTHGQSDRERAPGSIGQGTTPGRVWKGKKMAGHMGNEMAAVRGSRVVFIDEENQELWLTGSIPGRRGTLVKIEKMKSGKFVGLYQSANTSESPVVSETAQPESVQELAENSDQ